MDVDMLDVDDLEKERGELEGLNNGQGTTDEQEELMRARL